jgi:phosphinothricin acetyltransferase
MIRLANADDASVVASIYRPYVTTSAISFEEEAPSTEEMRRRMAQAAGPWLVFERAGRVVGYAYGSKHRDRAAYAWSADVSVYVGAEHHRGGIGRALYTSLFELLRLQGFYAAHAGITLPNAASMGLHESLGFRLVGVYPGVGFKRGAWHDVGWWQLPLRARDGVPAPLRTVEELRCDPGWEKALAAGSRRSDRREEVRQLEPVVRPSTKRQAP